MLAPRCNELIAADISRPAVRRTRRRLRRCSWVRVERRTLPLDVPDGSVDLIVCSGVLYYWPREVMGPALERFRRAYGPVAR